MYLDAKYFYSFFVFYLAQVLADDGFILTNPGYPKPYKGTLDRNRYNHTVDHGKGVALFFYQFLANPGDCVIICDDNEICQSLCGDAMDHQKTKKVLVANSSATITMISTSKSDGNYHSGIYLKSISFDLKRRSYFQCNSTVKLEDGMPFFLVSQNYPNSAFDYGPCTVTFLAKDAIRAAIYDLVTINAVRFKGFDLFQQPVDILLRGKHVTDDEPMALYFTNTLQVSFAFADTLTSYRRGFYVLVDSYSRKMNSTQSCLNEGNFVLDAGQKIPIGTINFGNETYGSHMKCSYVFENNRENHQIALGMGSETEKCCDILLIGGLAPPPSRIYNYQGFIQPVFQFASTNKVSLEFTSDGVVEGVGFSGNVYNIDCTCNSGNRYLSEESSFLQLTSPGLLSGAPTYCPNISCYWIIKFSTEYEIVSRISTLSLRSYMEQDLLTIIDRFGRVILRANSDVTGPKDMITTSGELSLNFTSSPTTAFPLSAIRPGFIIEITQFKKNIHRKEIIFTDDNFLVEISTKSFHEGLNITYEYALTARAGKTVTVYFLTTLKDVVNLDIYDGPDTVATVIDPRILYENFTRDGEPLNVVSSQEHLLIRIRPNLFNTETNLDFRAMATDWQQDRKCPPILWSASTVLQTDAIRLTGTDCFSIFHVNKDYEPSIGITVELEEKSSLSHIALFKGLTTNISNLVMSGHDRQYPNFIYGMYVVMFYNSTQSNSVTYSWRRGSFATTLLMTPNESGIIMSEDYLPSLPLPSFEQEFSIELIADSHLMSGIKIEFLRAPGQGHGTFQFQQYNKLLDDITFPVQDGRSHFERCGNKLIVTYISPGGTSSGLYARYSAGALHCNSGSIALNSITSTPVFLTAIFCISMLSKR